MTIGYGTITLLACSFQPPPHESSELKEKKSILKLRSFAGTKEQRENLDRRLNALGVKGAEAGDPHPNLTAKDVERVTKELFLREMGPGMAEDALLVGQLNNEEIENLIIVEEEEPERHGSGVGLLHKAPQNQNLLPGAPPKSKSLSGDQYYQLSKEIEQHSCPTFYYGFFSRSFLLLAIMAFSCAIYNYFLVTAWKALFKSYLEFSDSALANLLIIGACSNSSFRVIVGVLLLKVTFIYFYRTAVSVIIISAFTFDFVVISGGHELDGRRCDRAQRHGQDRDGVRAAPVVVVADAVANCSRPWANALGRLGLVSDSRHRVACAIATSITAGQIHDMDSRIPSITAKERKASNESAKRRTRAQTSPVPMLP